MTEALQHAMFLAKEQGLTYINGYDHPHIIAGQGTVAMEIVAQMEDPIDAIIVPVGGGMLWYNLSVQKCSHEKLVSGGLIAGIATAAKALLKDVKIIVSSLEVHTIDLNFEHSVSL